MYVFGHTEYLLVLELLATTIHTQRLALFDNLPSIFKYRIVSSNTNTFLFVAPDPKRRTGFDSLYLPTYWRFPCMEGSL